MDGAASSGPGNSAGGGGGRVEGPARFRWGQRLYAVHAVLDHWVEAGNWWRRTGRSRTRPGGAVVGIDDGEREVWRVEARQLHTGKDAPLGVFDLNFDWSAGRWSLIRVHD
ncbi:MAG: hypothetical protein H0V67_09190 [Geodermatophilaceae bacterium]|nr:hypothetical protein [Geodermatophilaceae bacterium]